MYPHPQIKMLPYQIQPGDTYWLLAEQFGTNVHEIVAANPHINPYYLLVGQMIHIPVPYYNPVSESRLMHGSLVHARDCISQAACDLKSVWRSLWEQHVEWTRMLIISIATGLPDEDLVTKRLLRNPSDMADALQPFYGKENAAMFEKLMTEHLVLAVQLVKAANAGDSNAAADAEKRWYHNADQLAAYLSSLNPYWPEDTLRSMLYEHLALTKSQAVYRIKKEYASDIATYDKIEQQALEMADAFSGGIVKQFPDSFRCG